jgi:phosphoribosylaminoimidazole-succinocarboxamide synthase
MREAERLEVPLFTPSTKADEGHDLPLTSAQAVDLVGADLFEQLRAASAALYEFGAAHAANRGVILADTKFEFGLRDGDLMAIDELMTPDSSRYWPAEAWRPGSAPPSFDKQYVRDYMTATGWNKEPPPPSLPDSVIANTRAKYIEAYEMITGQGFDDWYTPDE